MNKYNRYHKIDWLKETCTKKFMENEFLHELVNWMGEDDFEAFYDRLCRTWYIKRDPNDPKFDPETDNLD